MEVGGRDDSAAAVKYRGVGWKWVGGGRQRVAQREMTKGRARGKCFSIRRRSAMNIMADSGVTWNFQQRQTEAARAGWAGGIGPDLRATENVQLARAGNSESRARRMRGVFCGAMTVRGF